MTPSAPVPSRLWPVLLGLTLLLTPPPALAQPLAQPFAPTLAQTAPQKAAPATRTPTEQAALNRGRSLLREFYAVRLDTLWNAFTPEVRGQWGTLTGFRQFREGGVRDYGAEREVVRERTLTRAGVTYYVRSATFEKAPKLVWAVVMGFEQDGRISTFGITLEEDLTEQQVAQQEP